MEEPGNGGDLEQDMFEEQQDQDEDLLQQLHEDEDEDEAHWSLIQRRNISLQNKRQRERTLSAVLEWSYRGLASWKSRFFFGIWKTSINFSTVALLFDDGEPAINLFSYGAAGDNEGMDDAGVAISLALRVAGLSENTKDADLHSKSQRDIMEHNGDYEMHETTFNFLRRIIIIGTIVAAGSWSIIHVSTCRFLSRLPGLSFSHRGSPRGKMRDGPSARKKWEI